MTLDQIRLEKVSRCDLEKVVKWHKEHVLINFPGSMYLPDAFRKIIYPAFDDGEHNRMIKIVLGSRMIAFYWIESKQDQYKMYDWYCELRYVHIAKRYRGKGLGTLIMASVEKDALLAGAHEIRLGTHASNDAALKLYEKSGFKISRVIMEKHICQPTKKSRTAAG